MRDGIRRSEDLRARFRKFLILTNERKKMSKKTIKQRIALVAVAALGGTLLTFASTSNANAATGAVTQNPASTGIVSALASGSAVAMTVDGVLSLNIATGTSAISVSGGKITGFTSNDSSAAGVPVITADGTGINWTAGAVVGLTFKPTVAGTNMVIKTYAYTGTVAAAIAAPTAVQQTITATIYAAGTSGTFNAGKSFFSIQAIGSGVSTVADALYENQARAGNEIVVNYDLVDALGTAGTGNMPASTSVVAQITSGACVVGSTAGSGTLPLIAEYGNSGDFFVAASDSAVATKCTLAIAVDGTVRATKDLIFQGPAAKITVTKPYIGKTSTSNTLGASTGMGLVTVTDSAGNVLGGVAVSVDTTTLGSIVSNAAISNSGYTSSRPSDTATSVRYNASAGSTPSFLEFTCTSAGGSTTIKLKTSLSNGTSVTSDAIPVSCASDVNTYTASLDKASYVPGDIATLTITAKDSSGRLTNDAAVLGSGTTTQAPVTSGSNMTAVTAAASTDTFSSGVKTYRFVVGATTGSYNMIVDLPFWNATSTVGQTAVTVSYKIASSTTEVSNADVLKSIVALIASINKQIQALQKLILKR